MIRSKPVNSINNFNLSSMFTYLKTAFRHLWKNRTYNFLNISGLAVGIACAGLIFLWAEDEIAFDNINVKKHRLYKVAVNLHFGDNIYTMGSTPRPMAAALKTEVPGIVNTARVSDENQRALFSFGDKSLYASGLYADPSIFDMFTLDFVQGNTKTAFSQLYSMVITESAAKKIFGDEKNILGKTVRINNDKDFSITGVLKDLPENSTLQFEWLAPYHVTLAEHQANKEFKDDSFLWNSYGPFTYVELAANANPAAINKQLQNFIKKKDPTEDKTAILFPMTDWRLYSEFQNGKQTGSGRIKQLHLLSSIAWIILFIACINFMNLATANSQKRSKEVGVRKVLGAGRKTLIIRFIGETLLMSFIAAIAAIILIALSLPSFNMLMQKHLSLALGNPFHLIALLIITLICGLVAGSYPSMYLSSFNPALVLKGWKIKTGSASLIRKGLVVLQFTVSIVFIISTIIVYRQINYVKNRQPGFNKNNLVEIDLQHNMAKSFTSLKQDLLQTGLVENAALTDHKTIANGNTDNRFLWEGKSANGEINIAFRHVSNEFVSTSGMQLTEGKDFNAGSANTDIIITESLEKIMGKESAIGKIIQSPRDNEDGHYTNLTVVGVVKDYVYGNAYSDAGPVMFICKPGNDEFFLYVRVKPKAAISNALDKIGGVIKKDNPAYPFEYKFVDEQFNELFQNEMLISKISGVFATLAIIISCLGLFGLAAFTAGSRTKEIGVRKVLGASVTGIAGMLSKDFLQLVIISCIIAFPLAWWIMHDWLQAYQYRITISLWIFIAAGIMAIMIALITVSSQAIKAAMANPVNSLRTE